MEETIQQITSQSWFIYAVAAVAGIGFIVKNFTSGMNSAKRDVSFRHNKDSDIKPALEFSLALDAIITAYWQVDNNTLSFTHKGKKPKQFNSYMSGWYIDTTEGYKDLTNYFIQDGRRDYFDFVYPLYQNEPKENWAKKIDEAYGNNARPTDMLKRLSKHNAITYLKQQGVIEFDSDMDLGVAGWDVSVLIGQARRAFTAGLISEKEALAVIQKATKLAQSKFNSWEELAKSQVIGVVMDMYKKDTDFCKEIIEVYHETLKNSGSPWNNIQWQNK